MAATIQDQLGAVAISSGTEVVAPDQRQRRALPADRRTDEGVDRERDLYMETIEAAGFEILELRENDRYRFISDRADKCHPEIRCYQHLTTGAPAEGIKMSERFACWSRGVLTMQGYGDPSDSERIAGREAEGVSAVSGTATTIGMPCRETR